MRRSWGSVTWARIQGGTTAETTNARVAPNAILTTGMIRILQEIAGTFAADCPDSLIGVSYQRPDHSAISETGCQTELHSSKPTSRTGSSAKGLHAQALTWLVSLNAAPLP